MTDTDSHSLPPDPTGSERTVVRQRPSEPRQPPAPSVNVVVQGNHLVDQAASLVGQRLGEYEVEAHLGAGGMGIVYRGIQPQIGKRVAIKVLRPETAAGKESFQALLAEARAANSIRHPGIVDIFSFGTTPAGAPYVVMELLEGKSLDQHLADVTRLHPVEAIDVLEQMLSALDAAHAAGVIHRDLKPANVHLSKLREGQWQVKLLDFGLAKLTDGASSVPQTSANIVKGTPQYMAPEQARALAVSTATDLYAVGVIAFELLTGKLPFDAPNPLELLMQHVSATPPALGDIDSSIPQALEELVARLLLKDPLERPRSAQTVRRELVAIRRQLLSAGTVIRSAPLATPAPAPRASALPVAAPAREPSPITARVSVPGTRRRMLAGGAGLVVVAGLVAWLFLRASTQAPVPSIDPETPVAPAPRADPGPTVADPVADSDPKPPVVEPPRPIDPVLPNVDPVKPPVVAKPPVERPIRPVALVKAKRHTRQEVESLLSRLEVEAKRLPSSESRARLGALADYREALSAGTRPDQIWKDLKEAY